MDHHNHGGDHSSQDGTESHDHTEKHAVKRSQSGNASYGWLWIVGIIIVVAVALFFLQRTVPDATAPSQDDPVFVDENGNPVEFGVDVDFNDAGIYNVAAPSSASSNAIVGLSWEVSAPETTTIPSTSVRWGTRSGSYEYETEQYLTGTFTIPAYFEANIRVPEGAENLYGVAIAEIDGEQYTSEEFQVKINR